ncbi:TIGR02680 family protein [Listeria rustica]|uniref:TIGR02680 family protein n=1 Tax=Listeria rustica TaxID=2713503 RepID=A0A7W1T5J2_9LIST|nr:TIGR02680 family protein [Listeria rustica]MBA3925839.1 TIGR02680 family protein [Listeria rustica]
MSEAKWHLNRAGIFNYWYYDETYFDFSDGKMLLRGSNGSGKSVTTASLLPMLLDGKTNPTRLDPFGSGARKIEDYLLGEKDISTYEERTGYLMLEYKSAGMEKYITTGIGIQARRDNKPTKWYFVITDGRRIGTDIELLKKEGDSKRPLSRKQLENVVAGGGFVVQTRREYAELVNRFLFGFETMDAFEDMVNLLVELRKPKLSKDFTPTVIYSLLEDALPPLKDDTLHSVSDSLENIDVAQGQLLQAKQEFDLLKRLGDVYSKYHQAVLAKVADKWLYVEAKLAQKKSDLMETEREQESLTSQKEEIERDLHVIRNRLVILNEEESSLKQHNVFMLGKERKNLEELESRLTRERTDAEDQLGRKKRDLTSQQVALEALVMQLETTQKDIRELQEELEDHAQGSGFKAHETLNEDYARMLGEMDFSYWSKEARDHLLLLTDIRAKIVEQDRLLAALVVSSRKVGECEKARDTELIQEKDWLRIFDVEMEKIEMSLLSWKEGSIFPISDLEWQEVLQRLHLLYDETPSLYLALEPIRKALDRFKGELELKKVDLNYKMEMQQGLLVETRRELESWQQTEIPEPERESALNEERRELEAAGERVWSFYELVDFHEHVPQDVRNRMEGALNQAGIMDALVSEKPLKLKANRQIIANPVLLSQTLEDFLYPVEIVDGISSAYVAAVLQSIEVDSDVAQSATVIASDGNYRIGILDGTSLPMYEAMYVGRENRERYRQSQIEKLEAAIVVIEQEKLALQNSIQQIEERVEAGNSALLRLPVDTNLVVADREIKATRTRLQEFEVRLETLKQELVEQKEAHSIIELELNQWKKEYGLKVTEADILDSMKSANDYIGALGDLQDNSRNVRHTERNIVDSELRLDGIREEIDEKEMVLSDRSRQLEKVLDSLASIRAQLELEGEHEILARIDSCLKEKTTLTAEEMSLRNKHPYILADLRTADQLLAKLQTENHFYGQITVSWERLFKLEYARYEDGESADWSALALYYQERFKEDGTVNTRKRLANLTVELMQDLSKYSPTLQESVMLPVENWMEEAFPDDLQMMITEWREYSVRQLLDVADEQNRRASIFAVIEELQLYISEQEGYLKAEDHKLFEEILLHSIGNVLRQLINRAEKWAIQMNQILKRQENSSGLSLSIEWRARAAEQEGELHTKDLVELLRRGPQTLSEAEVERMIQHFRSKIDYAKVVMEKDEEIQTLHDVMKYVLDYRKWFEFKLSYKKENEPKRELSNTKFYQFSGGEKAISMYLPLFTAVYSRYQDAENMAPYIIALDEAFAGIDELNIAELFKATEELGFDYILNSQSLWGDYATVQDLNIYQLIRPKNANFVTYLAYHWNGNKRVQIGEEVDESEAVR